LYLAFSYSAKVQKISWTSGWTFSSMKTFAGRISKTSENQAGQSKMIGLSTGNMHAVAVQYMARSLEFSPMPQSEVQRAQTSCSTIRKKVLSLTLVTRNVVVNVL
jgi:hypothetical protein